MVKKDFIKKNQAYQNIVKIHPESMIILFLIFIFLAASPITGCRIMDGVIIDDSNDQITENNNTMESDIKYIPGEEVSLPGPVLSGTVSLEESLFRRRSIRDFRDKEIEIEKISQLLWAAQGITKENSGFRTAPSAGALYPLEIFVIKKDGLFHYIPAENILMKMSKADLRQRLYEACLYQSSVAEADINLVIAAVYDRTTVKYGERGIRYVHLEAGHACQNILLEAVALGLGAVPIGAFEDSKINTLMELKEDYIPLYVIPVGYPE